MKPTRLQKAWEILQKCKIEKTGEGNNRLFFNVASVPVEVRFFEDEELFLLCTCKHCTIHSNKEVMCCFKTALITYLMTYGRQQ